MTKGRGRRREEEKKKKREEGRKNQKEKESPAKAAKRIAILRSGGGEGALIQALIGPVCQQRGNNYNANNSLLLIQGLYAGIVD